MKTVKKIKHITAAAFCTLYGLVVPALALDASQINEGIETASSYALSVLQFIFGTTGAAPEFIFQYLLPGLLVFFIMYDMIYLLGFFRRTTARVIAAIFALFAGRFGTYTKIVELIRDLMGVDGLFVPSITLVFTLIMIWWVVGHVLLGFKVTKSMYQAETGLDMLMRIGDRLEQGPGGHGR